MGCIVKDEREWVFEHGNVFIETDAMLPNVGGGFCGIPLKSHNYILPQFIVTGIRANKLGVHFRRQQVIQGFIVDFYCHKAGLSLGYRAIGEPILK